MRIDEISEHNRILAFLTDLKIYYQPTWLQVRHLLEYFITTGDPVDPQLVTMCDSMDQELSRVQTYDFDPNDPDLPRLLQEVAQIRTELQQYRSMLNF